MAYDDYIGSYEPSCGEEKDEDLLFDVKRWTISLEYSDDINSENEDYNIYIKSKNKLEHKNIIINNMFLHPRFNYSIRFIFTSYSIDNVNGVPDGKSEKSFCSSGSCLQYTMDLPYKRAFNPHSTGYDCGDEDNWIIGEYSRIHRDIDIINAMRQWIFGSSEYNLNENELYSKDKLKEICDEKCLICNEESKREDKCLLCNIHQDYYPIINKDGSDEYYECHKKDEKIERYYFSTRDNGFLPCYETCRFCNDLGDINNHKCTECDYNYIKNYISKNIYSTFNCILLCNSNYYYTESGNIKCTKHQFVLQKKIYISKKEKNVYLLVKMKILIFIYSTEIV